VSGSGQPAPARPEKGPGAFRTIGEVADALDLPAHVLRFWESKFPQLKPLKRGGGRRYYRPEDIRLLRHIRHCLYRDGYTIRGVQQLLASPAAAPAHPAAEPRMASLFPLETAPDAQAAPPQRPRRRPGKPEPRDPALRAELEEIRRELLEARALLGELLKAP
jgi:DNA-binding transcriptional MerR regulator